MPSDSKGLIDIGRRIKDARTKAGKTQNWLADKTGVQPVVVSYIENGRRPIPKKQINKFSEALKIPVEELKAEVATAKELQGEINALEKEIGISFRNLQTLPDEAKRKLKTEVLSYYKELKRRYESNGSVHTHKDPVSLSKEVLDDCGIKRPPVNLNIIAKKHNIEIQQSAAINSDGWIMYPKGENWAGIKYKAGMGEGRIRFTIAHELGHFFLHNLKDAEQSCFMSENAMNVNSENKEREKQAHLFASNLLMPSEWILKVLPKKIQGIQNVRRLSHDFEVSLTAAAIRLVQVSSQMCAVIYSKKNTIEWGHLSNSLKSHYVKIKHGHSVSSRTQAYKLCNGDTSNEDTKPLKTNPEFWLTKNIQGSFQEHSVCIYDESILSLIWAK